MKIAAVDRAFFKGFAERLDKAISDEEDHEMVNALGLLRPSKDRVPPTSQRQPTADNTTTDNTTTRL